jgi:hypothetical protein
MKRVLVGLVALVCAAGIASAQSFTDVNTLKYKGKTGIDDLVSTLDANFALIETGPLTAPVNGGNVTIAANKDLIAITDNGATTNTVISNGAVDASKLTGAASGLTSVTASADVRGATVSLASGKFFRVDGTTLVFVAGAVTNVIDADIGTP